MTALEAFAASRLAPACREEPPKYTVRCPDKKSFCVEGSVCTPDSKDCVSAVTMCPDGKSWCTGAYMCTPDSKSCVTAVAYCADREHWCENGLVCTADNKRCWTPFRRSDD